MDISDGMDKSWDHPWTTEEMRKKRREWSLAGDAGLLKHLQQFSENLVSKANKTQEALDSLTTQLSDTAILIDNVTNTSLALANTQFIESRVQEDDVEIEKKVDDLIKDSKDQDLVTANLIASVSESVRQGLSIMDEKYRQMEVVDSDSEDEDEAIVLSVILGPNNPYQDRPLPYVIGSEKWTNSNKIGLESSSSESEQLDEEEEESNSDKEDTVADRMFDMNAAPKMNIGPLPSSLRYSPRNDIGYMNNGKIDEVSQNNVNSVPDSVTPIDTEPKVVLPSDPTPSFAEELAKRLGTVREAQKPVGVDEKNEASINRFKDDLFTPEQEDSVFNKKVESIFSGSKGFFSDQASENLWKEKPIKSFNSNIIPANVDVPPPISTISTKAKSAIDDLFGDPDSEDSDDIFSSKNTVKRVSKDSNSNGSNYATITAASTIAASTPEINVNKSDLFSDEEDDGDLFGSSKKEQEKASIAPTTGRKKPVEGISILGNILASDIENKVSSRVSQTQSSGSSGSDTPANYESSRIFEDEVTDTSRNDVLNDAIDERAHITGETSYSSGISIHPTSINNTEGSSIGTDFQPQLTSTLKSEAYRERIAGDSLFTSRTRNSGTPNLNSNSMSSQSREEQNEDRSSVKQNDVFENDGLFGPPPLPKADAKAPKSKVSSLFDDSDSGDELFSTTSSGSRSQRSTDFLTTTPQYPDKSKNTHRRGIFDEEIDIFGSKDSPYVDIFGVTPKPSIRKDDNNSSAKKLPDVSSGGLFEGTKSRSTILTKDSGAEKSQAVKTKKISLFDDEDDIDDGDLFGAKTVKSSAKVEPRIFKDDDENDLFSSKEVTKKPDSDKGAPDDKKESRPIEPEMDEVNEKVSTRKGERKGSDILSGNGLFSSAINSHGLVFEDDDFDDLFSNKGRPEEKKIETREPVLEDKHEAKIEESIDSHTSASNSSVFDKEQISTEDTPQKLEGTNDEGVSESSKISDVLEESANGLKKSPPKTLNIRNTVSSPTPDENDKAHRRTVSGKIKNLMGKMGDLKILSPMDTPPLWRKSEEKTDEEDDTMDRDSDDGGCISTQGHSSPPTISESSTTQKQSLQSTISGGSNVETAISFDEPAQVETLSTAASKTRARIQHKRRPQSRHARQSALRQSGIDFDTVDATEGNPQEGRANESSSATNKGSSNSANLNPAHVTASNSDRLSTAVNDSLHRVADINVSLVADDKSELGSLSKESSMSANKNTLLSPSTDEEDLFDVPPDLPEDPQKEDTLFSRAPILSPVDKALLEKPIFRPLRDTHIGIKPMENEDNNVNKEIVETKTDVRGKIEVQFEAKADKQDTSVNKEEKTEEDDKEMIDPLRDSSHDPLKDPSQLFAFVTKTPSPEKGKNLLFSEDDSLFSSRPKKTREDETSKKQVLDLFADDAEGDLFSTSTLAKPVKKPLKDTKINLFENDAQDDEDDSLFGSITKKASTKIESQKSNAAQNPRKKISLFDDDDNDINLFAEQSEQSQKSDSTGAPEQTKDELFSAAVEPAKATSIKDIFGDQSSGEEDIFAAKPVPKKVITSKSLFPSDDEDDEDGQIFGKPSSTIETKAKSTEPRPTIKKPVLRDLKKTAEKIGEDPLSIFQDE